MGKRWRWLVEGLVLLAAVLIFGVLQLRAQNRISTFRPSGTVVAVNHSLTQEELAKVPAEPVAVVRGTLQNQGSASTGPVRVVAVFSDRTGRSLGQAVGYPTLWLIPAQRTTPFVVVTPADGRIASYKLRIEEEQSG
ncbi:MAG: hypothetical protein CL878_05720 [Dehalococcoidia bacterium]|nr:hypothetical protein [Dehalococcoidia bacterium]